jgi:DNA-directed RNA polymerase III subunit RPC1
VEDLDSLPRRQGIPTIQRAIINVRSTTGSAGRKGDKELLVEGYGLQNVMTTEGELHFE